MVKAKDANADMRCLFDGLDFIPTEVRTGCKGLYNILFTLFFITLIFFLYTILFDGLDFIPTEVGAGCMGLYNIHI